MKASKRRDMLIEHADKARISRELVRLRLDTPLPLPVEALGQRDYDKAILRTWLSKQGFRSVVARLGLDGTAGKPANAQTQPPAQSVEELPGPSGVHPDLGLSPPPTEHSFGPYESVTTADALRAWVADALAAGRVAIDTETDGLDPMRARLVGFSLAIAPGRACYVPLAHEVLGEQLKPDAAIEALGPLLTDLSVLKIFHNAKFDMIVLSRAGFPMPAPIDDTMLISYAQEAGLHGHELDELSQLHLGHTPVSLDAVTGTGRGRVPFAQVQIDRATAHGAEAADISFRLWDALRPRLRVERRSGAV